MLGADIDPTIQLFDNAYTPGLHPDPGSAPAGWLACAVHQYLARLDGTVLQRVRASVRCPTAEDGSSAPPLRLDAFLWECWGRAGPLLSPGEQAALDKMLSLEDTFRARWELDVGERRRAVERLWADLPDGVPLVSRLFFPPGLDVHVRVRAGLARVMEGSGCVVNVPIETEPVHNIGTAEGIEKAKSIILLLMWEGLTNMDEDAEFTLARENFLTAQMTVKNTELGPFAGIPSIVDEHELDPGKVTGKGKGKAVAVAVAGVVGGGQVGVEVSNPAVRAAALNQFFSLQIQLQRMAIEACKKGDA